MRTSGRGVSGNSHRSSDILTRTTNESAKKVVVAIPPRASATGATSRRDGSSLARDRVGLGCKGRQIRSTAVLGSSRSRTRTRRSVATRGHTERQPLPATVLEATKGKGRVRAVTPPDAVGATEVAQCAGQVRIAAKQCAAGGALAVATARLSE